MKKNKYYAVAVGRRPGIYSKWFGVDGARIQIEGFSHAVYRGFCTIEKAREFLKVDGNQHDDETVKHITMHKKNLSENTKMYTDGCSLGNPGPGGYGTIILQNGKRKELSGGFKYTTNNRMELMACIVGLSALKKKTRVTLYSDSRYVINGIINGWAKNWEKNGWIKSNGKKAKNKDLWKKLLQLCSNYEIDFKWVKGHDGNTNNEKCDQLANSAANEKILIEDKIYEESKF